jgi:hypothetical protein
MNPLDHCLTLLLDLQGRTFVPSSNLLALPSRTYRGGVLTHVNGKITEAGRLLNITERFSK